MQTITLDAKDFLAGETNWDYISEGGGFSPDSYGLNLLLKPGVLNIGWTNTDRGGATLIGNIVAQAYDFVKLSGQNLYVDDVGKFYTLSGSTFTLRQTSTNTNGWQLGTTDMVQFNGAVYASHNGSTNGIIATITGTDMAAGFNEEWWISGLSANDRHPLEVVEGKMYIGDLNLIHTWDGTTSTASAITLPTDTRITSLRRHPDGRHLIAFTGMTKDFSHSAANPGKIYVINKDTLTWEREILVDAQIEGSRLVGGVVYCTWGKKLGYFTGSGVKFLKQLKTSATTYSQSMSNMENFFLVRDGTNVLLYGDLGSGRNSWHNIYQGSTVQVIGYKGSNLITIGTASATLLELDYGTASANGRFVSKRYNFGSVVKIRRMDFIFDKKSDGSIMNASVSVRDTDDNSNLITIAFPSVGTANKKRLEMDVTTDIFQFILQPSNGIPAYKLIRIYYEPIV